MRAGVRRRLLVRVLHVGRAAIALRELDPALRGQALHLGLGHPIVVLERRDDFRELLHVGLGGGRVAAARIAERTRVERLRPDDEPGFRTDLIGKALRCER
ncbi:MAG: hypothetical protein DMD89_05660 [Candidatus Rokuibacteriota bacterium]|nr:MAG: hypothetical protein DMD89_05660 [Candidatus Rokubacteria bacterium]